MTDSLAAPEPNPVLRLAIAALRDAPSGVAQHAIDAALGWSTLFVPTSTQGSGDAIVHNKETGARTVVAFTQERQSPEWGGYHDLVWRPDPAVRVAWRALGVDFEGILLDPAEGSAGVLVPRKSLRAVAGGYAEQEMRQGDNLALRLALDALRAAPTALARNALVEALANGGALVPAVTGEGDTVSPPYVFRTPADTNGDRVLHAFSDREALSLGPKWAGESAIVLAGPVLLDAVNDQGFSSLALNANASGPLVLTQPELAEIRERIG